MTPNRSVGLCSMSPIHYSTLFYVGPIQSFLYLKYLHKFPIRRPSKQYRLMVWANEAKLIKDNFFFQKYKFM